jgi:hypothetical protein
MDKGKGKGQGQGQGKGKPYHFPLSSIPLEEKRRGNERKQKQEEASQFKTIQIVTDCNITGLRGARKDVNGTSDHLVVLACLYRRHAYHALLTIPCTVP